MSFFNKIKNIFTGDEGNKSDKELSRGESSNSGKNIADKAIEKSLLGVKKYYEFKVKVVNQITDINPEWNFFDITTQNIRIKELKLKLSEAEKSKVSTRTKISENEDKINYLKSEYSKNEVIIDNTRIKYKNEKNINELNNIENEIRKLEEKSNNIKSDITYTSANKCRLNTELELICNEIREVALLLISEMAFIKGSYNECMNMANKYEINNNFTNLALKAIELHELNNLELAKNYVKEYFNNEINNDNTIHNPIIDGLYSKILIEQNKFKEAKVFLDYTIRYYPDSIELHKMLEQVHVNLNENIDAELEKQIINLLS